MNNPFFEKPVLNPPYECPDRHWELDETGQPTQKIIESRRQVSFITAVPTAKRQRGSSLNQASLVFDKAAKEKKATMDTYWVPGVNNHGRYGRWAFAEFTDVYEIESEFEAKMEAVFDKMIEQNTEHFVSMPQ